MNAPFSLFSDKNAEDEELFISAVTQRSKINYTEQVFAEPNRTAISFKLDTGASANLISTCIFRRLGMQDVLWPSTHPNSGE